MNAYKMILKKKWEEKREDGNSTRYEFDNGRFELHLTIVDSETEKYMQKLLGREVDFKGQGVLCELKDGKLNYKNSMSIFLSKKTQPRLAHYNGVSVGSFGTSANENEFDIYHSLLEADRVINALVPGYVCRYHPECNPHHNEFDAEYYGEFDMRDHNLLDEGLSREEVLEVRKGDSLIKNLLKSGKTCEEIADFCHFNLKGVKAVEAEFRAKSQKEKYA